MCKRQGICNSSCNWESQIFWKIRLANRQEYPTSPFFIPPSKVGRGCGILSNGGMAEWTIAAVLKTAGLTPRGFESLSLRPRVILLGTGGTAMDEHKGEGSTAFLFCRCFLFLEVEKR